MLDAGHYCVFGGKVLALISAYHCRREERSQIRVFAAAFGYASPAGVAGDINHRAVCPADSVGRCLFCGYPCCLFYEFRVPGTGKCERDGKYGIESVNDIYSAKHRDAETAFLDCNLLETGEFVYACPSGCRKIAHADEVVDPLRSAEHARNVAS